MLQAVFYLALLLLNIVENQSLPQTKEQQLQGQMRKELIFVLHQPQPIRLD
jgi:hypothetical protein